MPSDVNPDAISLTASGDTLVFPLREQLGIIRDEIAALQGGGSGGQRMGFWFASLAGGDLVADGNWHPVPGDGGGMTGDASIATTGPNGLTLAVEAVVQVRLWTEFAAAGTGEELVGIQLDETANGQGVAIRGQAQLLPDATIAAAAYDGWLAPGVIICPASKSAGAATVKSTSYVTAIITAA